MKFELGNLKARMGILNGAKPSIFITLHFDFYSVIFITLYFDFYSVNFHF